MNNGELWLQFRKALIEYVYGEVPSQSASDPLQDRNSSDSTSTVYASQIKENPLLILPFDIRESISKEYYETGMTSLAQKYVEDHYLSKKKLTALQNLFNDVYSYAVKKNKHILAYNTILVLSQLPYEYLGNWACLLAVAATRSKFLDVNELGVRCFENWEDKEACTFLSHCRFSESWLQEYADEITAYIIKDGKEINVLSEKDYTWQMAPGGTDSSSNLERYRSGYSDSGA